MSTTASMNPNEYSSASIQQDLDMPILCEVCLGPNPYVEMTKAVNSRACKICERGFTVYRWKPGKEARYKKTEICKTCAKAKNVCQTCIFDMQYGLPVQVRDSFLAQHERINLPSDGTGKRALVAAVENKLSDPNATLAQYETTNPVLEKLARRGAPKYDRNRAKLCSFYARGACSRGDSCPYRHEMPVENELSKQNLQDRFHGTNDPLAAKILNRAAGRPSQSTRALSPPEDPTVTTLWAGGLTDAATEAEIRSKFSAFGALTSVRVVPQKNCAFITFQRRDAAEAAAAQLHDNLVIGGGSAKLAWGKRADSSKAPGAASTATTTSSSSSLGQPGEGASSGSGLFSAVPLPPPPPGMGGPHSYASMSSTYFAGASSAAPSAAPSATPKPPAVSRPPGM